MHIGFAVERWKKTEDGGGSLSIEPLPEGANIENRLVAGFNFDYLSEHLPLVSCKDLFSDIEELTEDKLELIEKGSCLNPKTVFLQGTEAL